MQAESQSSTTHEGVLLPHWQRYGLAFALTLAVSLIRLALGRTLDSSSPLLLYVLAVLLASWYGGRGPGILTTLLSSLTGWFLFFEPRFTFALPGLQDTARLILFGVLGLVITLFADAKRRMAESLRAKEQELSAANRRLAEVLESISDGVFLVDTQWRLLYLNPVAQQQIAQNRDLVGESLWDAFPELDDSAFGREYRHAMKERVQVSLTASYQPLASWFEVRAYPSAIGLAVYFRNVNEERAAEEALAESERRFRGTFENAAVGIAHVGLDGRWLKVNRRLCEIAGYTREDLLQRRFQDITHPEDLATDLEMSDQLLSGERNEYSLEKRYVDRYGRSRWVDLNVSLERDANGKPLYFISIVQDIAERKRAEHALKLLNDDLRQFAYATSHDLQEPLRMVTSFTQLLLRHYETRLDDRGRQFIQFAVAGAKRMELLLEGLRTYWGVSDSKAFAERIPIREVVSEAVMNLETLIHEAGAIVTCDDLPTVSYERTALLQVFQNLIANAIKYRSPDRLPRVHVRAREAGDQWVFSVADNGTGIAPQYREQVFQLFKRLHDFGTSGSGIGLAICQKIVERRGGRIWIESSGPEGTTFSFSLPAAALERLDADVAEFHV